MIFYHKSKGFDNNNSEKSLDILKNWLPSKTTLTIKYYIYIFIKWPKNWSLNTISSDQDKLSVTIKTPKDKNAATKVAYAIRDKILNNCRANKFADSVNFDSVIKGLT